MSAKPRNTGARATLAPLAKAPLRLAIVYADGRPANDTFDLTAAILRGERAERDRVIRWLVQLDTDAGHEWRAPIEYANGILAGVHRIGGE